ncbi:MAG TPA: twin-arginine translocation signal domain-containing protein [Steroidobacteraceae bacterium]|nr:twin-arginine translocation signal domain-containing protein [Steroidobacteraceae bacterium]
MSTPSPELPAGEVPAFDRRAFLGTVGVAAGALVATSVVPFSVACAEGLRTREEPSGAGSRSAPTDEEGWHVDDICGHRPGYAHPIPHGPARTSPVLWERVDPIDYMLMI